MNSQLRKYVAPHLRPSKQQAALTAKHNTRHQDAPHWTVGINLNIAQHKADWEEGRMRHQQAAVERQKLETREHFEMHDALPLPCTKPCRLIFDGKHVGHSGGHFGAVLCQPTVFCQDANDSWDRKIKPHISLWPDETEFAYEGVERIATEWIHRRFLPLPRVPGNSTVTWQQRSELRQYDFDDFTWRRPTEEDFWFWKFEVQSENVISDEEGEELIGRELMALLDPQDQWT